MIRTLLFTLSMTLAGNLSAQTSLPVFDSGVPDWYGHQHSYKDADGYTTFFLSSSTNPKHFYAYAAGVKAENLQVEVNTNATFIYSVDLTLVKPDMQEVADRFTADETFAWIPKRAVESIDFGGALNTVPGLTKDNVLGPFRVRFVATGAQAAQVKFQHDRFKQLMGNVVMSLRVWDTDHEMTIPVHMGWSISVK